MQNGRLKDCLIKILNLLKSIKSPKLNYYGNQMGVIFSGSCLKQDKNTYDDGKVVKFNIVYEISKNISSCPTLENCLFCAVTLTKNVDIDE